MLRPRGGYRQIGIKLLGIESREPLGDTGRSSFKSFFTNPALILQKQMCVAQPPQHTPDFIALSVDFSLRRAQPINSMGVRSCRATLIVRLLDLQSAAHRRIAEYVEELNPVATTELASKP